MRGGQKGTYRLLLDERCVDGQGKVHQVGLERPKADRCLFRHVSRRGYTQQWATRVRTTTELL